VQVQCCTCARLLRLKESAQLSMSTPPFRERLHAEDRRFRRTSVAQRQKPVATLAERRRVAPQPKKESDETIAQNRGWCKRCHASAQTYHHSVVQKLLLAANVCWRLGCYVQEGVVSEATIHKTLLERRWLVVEGAASESER
jgi:hypothetical protein